MDRISLLAVLHKLSQECFLLPIAQHAAPASNIAEVATLKNMGNTSRRVLVRVRVRVWEFTKETFDICILKFLLNTWMKCFVPTFSP